MPTADTIPLKPLRRARHTIQAPPPGAAHVLFGDNMRSLQACQPGLHGRVGLIYLDPPFFTGRTHERVIRTAGTKGNPVDRSHRPAFDDHWEDLDAFLDSLRQRLQLMRELLIPEGSVIVHVDSKTSHYVKVVGDKIFGMQNFASEIIWRYRRWPSKTKNFQRVHDVLLRWVRDADASPRFVQLYEPLAPSTLKTWGKGKQRAVFDKSGRRRRSSTESKPSPGVPMGDVWEIPIVAPVARERTGYPTQKPEALLHRIIEACSLPGDVVLDPYMGSGTTLAVGARLGRSMIGMDCGTEALEVTTERLAAADIDVQVTRIADDGIAKSWEDAPTRQSGVAATGTRG